MRTKHKHSIFSPANRDSGAMNDLNPSLSLRDEGIDMILRSLHSIRDRALSKQHKTLYTCETIDRILHPSVPRMRPRPPHRSFPPNRSPARLPTTILLRRAEAVPPHAGAHPHHRLPPYRIRTSYSAAKGAERRRTTGKRRSQCSCPSNSAGLCAGASTPGTLPFLRVFNSTHLYACTVRPMPYRLFVVLSYNFVQSSRRLGPAQALTTIYPRIFVRYLYRYRTVCIRSQQHIPNTKEVYRHRCLNGARLNEHSTVVQIQPASGGREDSIIGQSSDIRISKTSRAEQKTIRRG